MQILNTGRNVHSIKRNRAIDFLRNETQGRIFSVYFQKKTTGEMREMTCRRGVKAHLSGGDLPYDPAPLKLLPVFDVQLRNYRMVNLAGLVSFNIGGETFVIV
jgi:hypothetical protein